MAKHFVEWVHQHPINPITLLTGGILGGAVLTQAAGPSLNKALRPGPTPVLTEDEPSLNATA